MLEETEDLSGAPLLANHLGRISKSGGVMPLEAALSATVLYGDQESSLRLLHLTGMGIDKYQQNRHISRVATLRAPELSLTEKTLKNDNHKPLIVYRDEKSKKFCVTFVSATDDNGQRVKKTEQGKGSGYEHAIDGITSITHLTLPDWVSEPQRITNPRYEERADQLSLVQYPMPEELEGAAVYPVKDFQRYPIAALKRQYLPLYVANSDRLLASLLHMRSVQYIEFSEACEEGRHAEGIEMLVKRAGNAFKANPFKLTKSSSSKPPPTASSSSSSSSAPSSSSSSSSSSPEEEVVAPLVAAPADVAVVVESEQGATAATVAMASTEDPKVCPNLKDDSTFHTSSKLTCSCSFLL
jgi:hypothetical protein